MWTEQLEMVASQLGDEMDTLRIVEIVDGTNMGRPMMCYVLPDVPRGT